MQYDNNDLIESINTNESTGIVIITNKSEMVEDGFYLLEERKNGELKHRLLEFEGNSTITYSANELSTNEAAFICTQRGRGCLARIVVMKVGTRYEICQQKSTNIRNHLLKIRDDLHAQSILISMMNKDLLVDERIFRIIQDKKRYGQLVEIAEVESMSISKTSRAITSACQHKKDDCSDNVM